VDVSWAEAGVGWREFSAWRLVGEGSRNAWEWLEGQGLACTEELARSEDPRRLSAGRIRLVFDNGEARTVRASNAVRVESGQDWGEGGELELSLLSRSYTLLPGSGKRVSLGGAGATAWCDRLQGEEGGATVARGQVVGVLVGGQDSAGGPPVRFAAASATAARGGDEIVLDGDARLWQGERVVRADHLAYDRAKDLVTGRGNVLTTARNVAEVGGGGILQVRARELRYDRTAGLATYEGDVALDDPEARASCQRLVATLDGNGNLVLATLDGGVTVRDLRSAREITGQRARFVVSEGFFEIWGSPVLVRDPSGDQVKADHLQWMRASNTIVVLGTEDNPSETLYHPTQTGPKKGPPGRKP
jgi:lipopolysaccharide export system protein LptA